MFGMKKDNAKYSFTKEDFSNMLYFDLTPDNVDKLFQMSRYSLTTKRPVEKDEESALEIKLFGEEENENYPNVYFNRFAFLLHNSNILDEVKYLFGQLQAIHLGKDATSIDAMRAKFMGGPTGIVWADEEHTKELYELMYLGVGTGLIAPLREVTLKSGKRVIAVDLKHAKAKEIIPCVSTETRTTFSEIFSKFDHPEE